jgi:cytochrome c-type biogenesis protein CcmH
MKILKLFFIIFFIFSFNHLKANNEEIKIKITKNLRCLVCQGQSVYDSDSEFAISMKVLVDKKLEEGFSEIQIYDFFKKRYGEWILYDPELNKNTYVLWILPVLIFLIGGAIIFMNFNFKN